MTTYLQQGVEQGVQQGQLKVLHQLAVEQAERRFSALTQELRERIQAVTDQDLLRRMVLEIPTLADEALLVTWLDSADPA